MFSVCIFVCEVDGYICICYNVKFYLGIMVDNQTLWILQIDTIF